MVSGHTAEWEPARASLGGTRSRCGLLLVVLRSDWADQALHQRTAALESVWMTLPVPVASVASVGPLNLPITNLACCLVSAEKETNYIATLH
jgi:hypothetical protein